MKKIDEIKEKMFSRFKNMTFKSYLKETVDFFNHNLKKPFITLCIISLLIVVIGVSGIVSIIQSAENNIAVAKKPSFGELYLTSIQVISVIVFSGIVPYMYVPLFANLAGGYSELTTFANLIVEKGYLRASIIYVIPMLLNIVIIALAASLGMYICKSVTIKYKLDNMKHMNGTNFRLELYKLTKKDKKEKQLENKKNKKLKELESKYKKIDYFMVLNVTLILFVMQLVASLLKVIVI